MYHYPLESGSLPLISTVKRISSIVVSRPSEPHKFEPRVETQAPPQCSTQVCEETWKLTQDQSVGNALVCPSVDLCQCHYPCAMLPCHSYISRASHFGLTNPDALKQPRKSRLTEISITSRSKQGLLSYLPIGGPTGLRTLCSGKSHVV